MFFNQTNCNQINFKKVATLAIIIAALGGIALPAEAQGMGFNGYVPQVIHNYDTMQPFFNSNIQEAAKRLEAAQEAKRAQKAAAKEMREKQKQENADNEKLAHEHRHWLARFNKHQNELAADGPQQTH